VVRVKVYDGKNFRMVTPTPGTGVNQAILVPYADIDTTYPPIEISNSVSP
jgi:hypothetical protein